MIGGTSLFGGRGTVWGTLLGALIVGVFRNGLALAGLDVLYQTLAVGVLVIVAVSIDQWIRKVQVMTMNRHLQPPTPTPANPSSRPGASSRPSAASSGSTASAWTCTRARCWPSSATTAPASPRSSSASPARRSPTTASCCLDGQQVHFKRPQDARDAGIETVYQTLAVSPALDVASNLFLGREMRRPGVLGSVFRMLDTKRHAQEGQATSSPRLGISTLQDVTVPVENLSGGQRQAVAVARAAAFGSKVVVLDEPTAALGVRESNQVLELVKRPARPRPAGHPDQPQHAARVRGRRPDPHPAPRQARGARSPRSRTP